jgi:type II secretory pathway pseudopilin PulG
MEERAMSARRTRSGFTLIELLVLIALALLVGGLLLAAMSKVRGSAGRTQCMNNLKQIVLAVHNCNDTYTRLPPGVGTMPPVPAGTNPLPNFGNAFFFLTPFMEANVVYKGAAGMTAAPGGAVAGQANDGTAPLPKGVGGNYTGTNWAGFNNSFSTPIRNFQCPSDPSMPPEGVSADTTLAGYIGSTSVDAKGKDGYFTKWGLSSYAFNAQIFMAVDQNPADSGPAGRPTGAFGGAGTTAGGKYHENGGTAGKPLGYGYFNPDPGMLAGLDSRATLARSFPDGLSNTILACERYARCTSENTELAQPFHVGGGYWAYDGVDRLDGAAPSICFGSNAGINKPTATSGWLPASYTTTKKPEPTPVFPFFSWTLWDGPGTEYYKAGNMISIGPASKPLFKPMPFAGEKSQCDPRLASTGHDTMQAALADGSVRSIAPGISGETWWYACTPAGGETLGADW